MRLTITLLLVLSTIAIAQGPVAVLYELDQILTDQCLGGGIDPAGSPLSDGTTIRIYWDNDNNGPDGNDPQPPLCNNAPNCDTGPAFTCNYNQFPMNGEEILGQRGQFFTEQSWFVIGGLLNPSRFYLRICLGDKIYESSVFTIVAGPQDIDVPVWHCINDTICICSPPALAPRLTVSRIQCNRTRLQWTGGSGGGGQLYANVYRNDSLLVSLLNFGSYVDSLNVQPLQNYTYRVAERCSTAVGPQSAPASIFLTLSPPTGFFPLPLPCGNTRINWSASSDYDSVIVYRDGLRVAAIPATSGSYDDVALSPPGTTHEYAIAAKCGEYETATTLPTVVTPSAATLFAERFTDTSFVAGWTIQHDGTTLEPWQIFPAVDGGFVARTSLIGTGATAAERLVSPGVSLSLVTNAQLVFDSRFVSSGNATGYISASIDGGFSWPYQLGTISSTQNTTITYTLPTGLNNRPNVRFRWRFAATIQGTASWEIDDIFVCGDVPDSLPPSTISDLSITDSIGTAVRLTWSPAYDANFLTYEVVLDTVLPFGATSQYIDRISIPSLGNAQTSSVMVSSVFYGIRNYFAIRARDELGHISPISNIVSTRPIPEIAAPQFSTPFPAQGTTWWNTLSGIVGTRVTDASRVPRLTFYLRTDRNGDGTYDNDTWTPAVFSPLLYDSTVRILADFATESEALKFEIRCADEWGAEGYSGSSNTQGIVDDWYVRIDTTAPSPINMLAFAGYRSETEIQLTWTESSDLHFQRYEVYYAQHPGVSTADALWSTSNDPNLNNPVTALTTVSSLTRATRYYIVIRATDQATNASIFSNEITIATLGAPPQSIDDLVIKATGDDIVLTWSAVRQDSLGSEISVAGYRVYVYPTPVFTLNPEFLLDQVADTTYFIPGVLNLPAGYFFMVSAIDSSTPPAVINPSWIETR